MGGGEGSSSNFEVICQVCDQLGHICIECPWAYTRCKLTPCNGTRRVLIGKTDANLGRNFFTCQQPDYNGFEWFDDALNSKASSTTHLSKGGCFGCGEGNHWMDTCPWRKTPCP
ncbi:hypothetical protein BVC80_187g6 [Macleaya cordata]|uniref:GRF-type domain-containing protein n=1 Tax=Macleaya cordata TaxID=56857 RepID=A0A200Q7J2_MACCD|nr:hypothetical protein BVC80_187g6 [Macleaya cordata]